ncbi:cytochrome P450 76AD1-like [Chenopodium quinoa]|uniref:Cytochrome P450 76AD1-like protein n=1 Tax=Chenopodium quinoa TaxID=63459 RepID=A0A803L017_CHEQI|nr:cytochrome P450 76AD1-like [Chenopodium quinoa]
MEYYSTLLLLFSFVWAFLYLFKHFNSSKLTSNNNSRLPPGPKPVPILGNLPHLGDSPHRYLANLAKTYGPLISVKFGSITTIVVSSSTVAKEMFQKHDLTLSTRHVSAAVRSNGHDKFSVAWLPVCAKWRTLRKISALQLFSTQRLDASQALRQEKVSKLMEYVKECSKSGEAIDVGGVAFTTSLNLLSNTFFSFDLASYNSSDTGEFKELVWKIMEEIGKPNLVDCFPMLRFLSVFSVNCNLMGYGNKLNEVFVDIINKRLESFGVSGNNDGGDVLDTLIKIMKENESELSLDDIKHLLMDFFTAGTDTTSSTLEWAMTELLHSPEKMAKAQAELKQVLGENRIVGESDISKLPYLQAIVKETLRMHPPTVFLLPRKATSDVELYGYVVPKNAQVFVNLWAISRDPNHWVNPDLFSPERFLEREIDMKGQDFGLIPFGAGRRICPGDTLAFRMLNLMLGNLLHAFDWKVGDGLIPEDLDMTDKFGITIQKAIPLRAIPLSK